MSKKVTVPYYKSCDLPQVVRGVEVKPYFKIISLDGFDPDKYKSINGKYHPLNATSEPKIHYIIAQAQPYLLKRNKANNWNITFNIPSDGKTFNEDVELSFPYSNLFEYHYLLFVLSTYCYTKEGYIEEKYLNAGYLSLYNNHNVFRRGIYEVELHRLDQDKYKSLESVLDIVPKPEYNGKPKSLPELNRLLKEMRKKIRGELQTVPQEQIALSEVEKRIDELKKSSKKMFLSVDFRFSKETSHSIPVVLTRKNMPKLTNVNRNPVERKYFMMTRNACPINNAKLNKPNIEDLNEIKRIIKQSPTVDMTIAESDLLWKYRYYICDKLPTALSKVMCAVKWDYQGHTDQVKDILLKWPDMNPEYLMELLTSKFLSPIVRKFAVCKLEKATDDDLYLYLFHLVQALRYESIDDIKSVELGSEKRSQDPEPLLGSPTHSWLPHQQQCFQATMSLFQSNIQSMNNLTVSQTQSTFPMLQEDLATFLIRRCKNCRKLSTYFYWFLSLESKPGNKNSESIRSMFAHVLNRFKALLEQSNNRGVKDRLTIMENRYDIESQRLFVEKLTNLSKILRDGAHKSVKKNELLKTELPKQLGDDVNFILPLNPDFVVTAIDYENSAILKSSLYPIKLNLISSTNEKYAVIFKEGDDLRQDQVVLQMINFMDEILRRENFDLKLMPYKVLATSSKSGFIEFIESKSISKIHSEHATIFNYLLSVAPSSQDPEKIDQTVMDNYISSLAGYSVITYLLGVGDRHLDNIMLTRQGHLFHVDFGFVMGHDPKPLPPEVRITKDMIDAMGGYGDPNFQRFCRLAFETFTYLRNHANQCLSLLTLISDAGIQNFQEPEKTVEFVQERFMLEETEEQAILRLADRLTASLKAIMPGLMEKLHWLAMKRK